MTIDRRRPSSGDTGLLGVTRYAVALASRAMNRDDARTGERPSGRAPRQRDISFTRGWPFGR